MTYQEKRSLTFILTTIGAFGLYVAYIYTAYIERLSQSPNDFGFWGKVYLGLVPVVAIANIVAALGLRWGYRVFVKDSLPKLVDERDRWIELRAIWLSHCMFVFGFLVAMGTQAADMQPWIMFVTLGVTGFVSALTTEIAKLYLYRTGP